MIRTEKELRELIQNSRELIQIQNEMLKQQDERLKQIIENLKKSNSQTGTQPPDSPGSGAIL